MVLVLVLREKQRDTLVILHNKGNNNRITLPHSLCTCNVMYSAGYFTLGRIIAFCNTDQMCGLSDQSWFSTRDATNEIWLKKSPLFL